MKRIYSSGEFYGEGGDEVVVCFDLFWVLCVFVLALHYHANSKLIKFIPSLHSYDVPEVSFFDCCCFSLIIPSTLPNQGNADLSL